MALLWLAVFLTPASCLVRPDQDGHHSKLQVLSADPKSPIENFRMQATSKTLFWDVTGNVSNIECSKNSNYPTKAQNNHSCKFHVLPKCELSNYTVTVTTASGDSFSTWMQYPVQEGSPGAAARGLKCRVHDVDFLTCSWEVGTEAPGDAQYHAYLEAVTSEKTWECPHYGANELGTRIQCQFKDISAFANVQYRFLVNGTSTESRIPCSEFITYLSHIEALSPPNMTVSCNKSHSVMEWKMSSRFYNMFQYELEIQKGTDRPYIHREDSKTSLVLSNPGAYTVRIRARVRFYQSSPWSASQSVVCHQEEDADLHFWLTPLVIALVTLLFVGCALFLCKRYSVLQKLFPPIPHMKDPLSDNMHSERMLAWESDRAGQEECPVAKVHVLEEK
ncbi:interleukin-3 receptor subunit alpha isoform X2 [Rhinolophus ferrumequinum]|uniref:Interleukin-3 receptor subunit alpha n=1 Tax=Rhinolophus ferrumequinum TaxID=59479 RepID=A0A671E814_RHIFE|nr:interleukin-3 receptor subunit alpha isoform X2 [Rhinolophus ferrumequinum]